MKQGLIIPLFILQHVISLGQYDYVTSGAFEQQMEFQSEEDNSGDAYLELLQYYEKHPLNLNQAEEDELRDFLSLSEMQVKSFLTYRNLFGELLHVYELQAVPLWDINTIQQLLPYITLNRKNTILKDLHPRRLKGAQSLLIRSSLVLEKARGFQHENAESSRYLGSRNRLYARYRYNYKNLLQYGMLADKDAGEQLFRGKQKAGFDFYSFHFFVRKSGLIKSLALGDYGVNMGQGLIHWQSLAFKKSADITAVKRQSPVLRPYTSSGEYNFHRGAGITLQKNNWEATIFLSNRKHSSNTDIDSLSQEDYASSLISNGYHRTHNELTDKNNIRQIAFGGCVRYSTGPFNIALNTVNYAFSKPLQKRDQPYNLYALKGKSLSNYSIDYGYTYKNLHLFGETAFDDKGNGAFLHGLMISPDKFVNASIVYRFIDKAYQSLYSNAFTENTLPSNEKGVYAGVSITPSGHLSIEAFMDVFQFPWLKYRVDAPSSGKEYFLQLKYTPDKTTEIYMRFKNESKPVNRSGTDLVTNIVDPVVRQNFRIHYGVKINKYWEVRNRCEMVLYDKHGPGREQGFLLFSDLLYKPPLKPWSGNMRLLFFETAGYNSRMYVFENDVLNSFSVPAIFDKGIRYYINMKYDFSDAKRRKGSTNKFELAAGFSQTVYRDAVSIGSGNDAINGNKKTEIKLQLMISM